MQEVNDRGFWEDRSVVAINEQLLEILGHRWYHLAKSANVVWRDDCFDALRSEAAIRLRTGFGNASVQALKDPRISLTLPFWLDLCQELAIACKVCVVNRAPVEVAQSLERRDRFPIGYGLRLYASYRSSIAASAPRDTLYIRYDELIDDASMIASTLSEVLPLNPSEATAEAVQSALRHQHATNGSDLLNSADDGEVDFDALTKEIERAYPVVETLQGLAEGLVERGLKLGDLGQEHQQALDTLNERDNDIASLSTEHRNALATIDQRDADISSLSTQHQAALATIEERDEQIREFDRRLSQLGDEHTHAQQVVRERDAELARIHAQLDKIRSIPGVGIFVRQILKHAQS